MNREVRILEVMDQLTIQSDNSGHIFTDREHLIRAMTVPLVNVTASMNSVSGCDKMTDAMCYVEGGTLAIMGVCSGTFGRKIWGRELYSQIMEKANAAIMEERQRKLHPFTPSLAYNILNNNR